MGDGKKLKEYIDEKITNVSKIAKETNISATTLYTIIQNQNKPPIRAAFIKIQGIDEYVLTFDLAFKFIYLDTPSFTMRASCKTRDTFMWDFSAS